MPDPTEYTLRRRTWAFRVCVPVLWLAAGFHRIRIEGKEHLPTQGAGLLLVKHRATRDSLLLSWLLYRQTGRTANYLMKYRAAGLPPQLLEAVGGIPVIRSKDILRRQTRSQRRDHLQAAREMHRRAMAYVAWLYKQDELVVAYPEGRFYPNRLGPLQTGTIRQVYDLTRQTDLHIPILPIGTAYKHQQGRRPRATFRVSAPYEVSRFPSFATLVDALREQLRTLSGLD